LIISYCVALALALACIAIGYFATVENGVHHSTSFSAIIATTRNSYLDRLVEGKSLVALPLDGKMRKVRLKFGELVADEAPRGHIAFGVEEEVLNIRKMESIPRE
jgi:hypothetical protein